MKYQFTIQGRPASKKNSRRNFGHISLPSEAFMRFQDDALYQLKAQWKGEAIKEPVYVSYVFAQKGKMSQDVDNAIASINDVLMKAGIILDDKLIHGGDFVKLPSIDWSTRIEIIEIIERES